MLAADEFTVGTFADAKPLSLILPRDKYEPTALIGWSGENPAALLLSEPGPFVFFECSDNQNWKGVIVPNVRIEVDESSLFNGESRRVPLGCAVRTDTRLVIRGKQDGSHDGGSGLTVRAGLPSSGDHRACFSKWQVVIGEGREKRILWVAPQQEATSRDR